MKRLRLSIICMTVLCLVIGIAPKTIAQGRMHFIRDTEIENTIRVYVSPLFEAAGLDANSVSIHIVNNRQINAFVAGGQKIFLHTGLLTKTQTPSQLIGVLAHEIGHIKGGHLSRLQNHLKNANNQSIVALVLGGAIAIATGTAKGLIAGASAGRNVGKRAFLAYTRRMEQFADQAALNILDATGQSAHGLRKFLQILIKQEKIYTTNKSPYTRSHPLNEDRLRHVDEHIRTSRYSATRTSQLLHTMHQRLRGKLKGFINPPEVTLREFNASDFNIGARYARAIALSKLQRTDEAISIIDDLIFNSPNDPFFYELKGDLLVKSGRTKEAIEPYKKTLAILPWAALIKVNLAQLLLESSGTEEIEAARRHLKEALRYEPEMVRAWRFLAMAEGRLGNSGGASVALAEEALYLNNHATAIFHAKRATNRLPQGSPGWLRAQDIEVAAMTKNKNK